MNYLTIIVNKFTLKLCYLWRYLRNQCTGQARRDISVHYCFRITPGAGYPRECYRRLIPAGFQFSPLATHYPGQVFSVRRLAGEFQYHLRLYQDGTVTGHYEWNYEFEMVKHIRGVDCRPLDNGEVQQLANMLSGVSPIFS